MRALSLIEALSACHQSKYVNGDYNQRGGIFIVSPPGSLKSTLIKRALEEYPDALVLSDINIQTLSVLKNSLIDGRYSTLAFGEFEKLYQRNPATAANIEGHIKALVEEGFQRASFEDQRAVGLAARACVIGGITPSCYVQRLTKWEENGFARRFLWGNYTLANSDAIVDAISRWKLISFGKISVKAPGNKKIPYEITKAENGILKDIIGAQPSRETPFVLIKKMFCVLKWRHGARKANEIIEDFGECLSMKGATLTL
jgi:hypothetical protein